MQLKLLIDVDVQVLSTEKERGSYYLVSLLSVLSTYLSKCPSGSALQSRLV